MRASRKPPDRQKATDKPHNGAVLNLRLRATRAAVDATACVGGRVIRRYATPSEPVFHQSSALRAVLEDPSAKPRSAHKPTAQLTSALLTPIQDLLDASTALELTLDAKCLQLPVELLIHRRIPVCLRMPVTCVFASASDSSFRLERPSSAFILSDFSADPDRACLSVASLFDLVSYHDEPATALAVLRAQGTKHAVVFSLHGVVGAGAEDHMQLGGERLLPRDLIGLKPRLAYFDSCRLATSNEFISTLRALGTNYCVAPFIMNEAGDSSTSAMVQFFALLFRGESPERALFQMRRSLWRLYGQCRQPQRIFRALAFRVYRLNSAGGAGTSAGR